MLMRYDHSEFSRDGSARYTFSRFGGYSGAAAQDIPDVAGQPFAQALATLQEAGIWPEINSEFSETVPAGYVISTGVNSYGSDVEIRFSRGPESAYQGATPQPLFLGYARMREDEKEPSLLFWAPESDSYGAGTARRAEGYGDWQSSGGTRRVNGGAYGEFSNVMSDLFTYGDMGDTRPSNASYTLYFGMEYWDKTYSGNNVYYAYDKPMRLTVTREKFIDSVAKDGGDYVIKSSRADSLRNANSKLSSSVPNEWGRSGYGSGITLYSWDDRGFIIPIDPYLTFDGAVADLDSVLIYYTESAVVNPDGSADVHVVYDEYVLNNR
jgi:hypothetical protein